LAQLVRQDVLLQVVVAEEATALESLVEMLELVAVVLELHGQQLHLLALRTLAAVVAAQVSAELPAAHLKVAMVAQV
jgi:hypothetical protein